MDDTKIFNLNRGALFSIYPNPTSDYLSINSITNNPYQIHLFDTNGKLILEKVDLQQNTRIDIHNFPSGIYFIQIQQEGNTYTEKIIIQ